MDNRAKAILSSVISDHGSKLFTSTAFCKVYLTGYLADYPQEKRILIRLKEQELPEALLEFKQAKTTEAALHDFIRVASKHSPFTSDDILWGVNTWAAAMNLPEQRVNMASATANTTLNKKKNRASAKSPSSVYKIVATASLAALAWVLPSHESDNFLTSQIQPTQIQKFVETATPIVRPNTSTYGVITSSTNAAEMFEQTFAKSTQAKNKRGPKPLVIGKTQLSSKKKNKQLRADIEAYLNYAQPFK